MRPVSLIRCLNKIIAKVLVRRMKGVMGSLIGEVRSAFLKGRNIMDGVVVPNEVMEEARVFKRERLVFKVDFAKAFDSIDWYYLLNLMGIERWLGWIKTCITTASANILVNGSLSGEFELGRGFAAGRSAVTLPVLGGRRVAESVNFEGS